MIVIQIFEYYNAQRINYSMWCIIFALMPSALKGLEFNISKKIEWCFVSIAIIFLIYAGWSSM